jgi:exodeoxyribonuclease-5
MQSSTTLNIIKENFPFEPTSDQQKMFEELANFLDNYDAEDSVFLLKGFAGTGKTTVVSSLINSLPKLKKRFVLLAPTGRAAKVLAKYSSQTALTIHKKIYYIGQDSFGGIRCSLQTNKHSDTIFIVDEASMIGDATKKDSNSFFVNSLLDDLIEYVRAGKNCKIIFVGDGAQLPPVGVADSPALNADNIKSFAFNKVYSRELKEVVRQAQDSGILYNATLLRYKLLAQDYNFNFFDTNYKDFCKVDGQNLMEHLEEYFSDKDSDNAVVITRSNKRANIYNQEIRRRILYREEELSAGDRMLVLKNNYYWAKDNEDIGFIANGDSLEIERIRKIENKYGFRFAHAEVNMRDYPNSKNLDVILMLDTIGIEQAALPYDASKQLWNEVAKDYEHIANKRLRFKSVKENKYINALQVKFAYAMTGHKTQGGQWNNVFIDQGYLPDGNIDVEHLRWLYTTVTRAEKRVFLINFPKNYFQNWE